MNHKLILIDGISGSGKSTTAQYINWQLNSNNIPATWYYEDEKNNPLAYEKADIEEMFTEEEARVFMEDFIHLIKGFVNTVLEDDKVHIIESYY